MSAALVIIQPYWHEDAWVFDDVSKGLEREPLDQLFEGESEEIKLLARLAGLGLSPSINYLVKDIPNARKGFILLLSSKAFAGYQVELTQVGKQLGAFRYEISAISSKNYRRQVWLPLTLISYFEAAPESLYVKAEPRRSKYDRIRELVALRDRIEELEQTVGKLTLENDLLRRGKDH